jgi:DNA-binding CsgD family transcriptional regulator
MHDRLFVSDEASDVMVKAAVELRGGDPQADLSPREYEIAKLVVRGRSSTVIGQHLGLSPKTVDTYRSRLRRKIGAADTPGLVRWAIRRGLVDLHE